MRSWKQVGSRISAGEFLGGHFGATWAILGAILDPAGRQGAPKIELFGTKSRQNVEKCDPE